MKSRWGGGGGGGKEEPVITTVEGCERLWTAVDGSFSTTGRAPLEQLVREAASLLYG